MRKIIANLSLSLDGVMEAPEKWLFPYSNDEMVRVTEAAMAKADALLLGRKTYEEFVAFWPLQPSDDPIAAYINKVRKIVVSTTLEKAEWNNATVLQGDVAAEITKLKQQPGKNISISGSATLVRSLLRHGLLDELSLTVYPLVLGKGRRFFEDGGELKKLTLVESRAFSTGAILLSYKPT